MDVKRHAKVPLSPSDPLQRRLLAVFDDSSTEDGMTAERLSTLLAVPVTEVEAELMALVQLGNLIQRTGGGGESYFSAAPRRKMLGMMLVDAGYITEAQLQEALAEQAESGERIGNILLERGHISKQTLGTMLDAQRGLPYVDLSAYPIDEQLVRSLPESLIMHHKVLPIARTGGEVHLAMLDPTDVMAVDMVGRFLSASVRPMLITGRDFDWAVTKFFNVGRRVAQSPAELPPEEHKPEANAAVAVSQEAAGKTGAEAKDGVPTTATRDDPPVVPVVDAIIQDAVRIGATEIHIEPELDQTRVRLRVDGLLAEKTVLPRKVANGVASRLKMLAGLDISERVRPQDGRTLFTVEGREFDLRIAAVGTAYGERLAIRILSNREVLLNLDELGLFPEQREILTTLLIRQHGMILFTGPAGSGKTSSVYASISYVNDRTRNVMTIEDPIEYRLAGITQVPVRESAGVTFDVGLRAILRHGPDVVMVGEVGDPETASTAVQAALTGHLVLTTLHTNNAPGALVRLIEMGVEPYLLTSSVLAVVGQRLIRVLCAACKRQYRARDAELKKLGLRPDKEVYLFEPAGCADCANLGYKGRTGIFEIMKVTDTVRELVLQRRPASALLDAAQAMGMQTLRQSATRKVLEGVTSIDERQRLVQVEAG